MPGASRYQVRLPEHDPEAQKAIEHARYAATMRPIMVWIAALGAAFVLHLVLSSWVVAAAILLLGAATAVMALWHARKRKDPLHRWLPAATAFLSSAWVSWATLAGLHWHWTLGYWLVIGGGTVLAWELAVHMGKATEHHDIAEWFRQAAHHTSVPGMTLNVREAEPGRITAEVVAPLGTPPERVQAAMTELESAGDVPAGTVTTSSGPTARRTAVAFVNPASLDSPRLYPGPSHPGGSIADPCRFGRFADGTDWEASVFPRNLPGWQLMVTGMTGSAKTTGFGYVALAEFMTRTDAAIIGIDPAKGEQFLGPLRPGLHHLATDMDDVHDKLWRLNLACRPRMDYLGARGLQKWEQDCGLSAVIAYVMEASWLFNALGKTAVAQWVLPMALAARSAGIFIVLEIQRASWEQIPPVIRAQLASVCMGVAQKSDAAFGLSHEQRLAGCDPGKWANKYPGKAFTDMPGIAPRHATMDARTDYFGPDSSLIEAHAAAWPAEARPLDDMTRDLLFGDLPEVSPSAATARQATARPAGPSGPPHLRVVSSPMPPAEEPRIPAVRVDPHEQLRLWVEDLIASGVKIIHKADLIDLTRPTSPAYIGRTEKWLYTAMRALADDGIVEERDGPRRWPVPQEAQAETETEEDA
jgi:hypothetical protein